MVDVPVQGGKTTAAARLDLDALAAQKGCGLGLAAQQVHKHVHAILGAAVGQHLHAGEGSEAGEAKAGIAAKRAANFSH